jgi:glycosyltransferase involved in cell wall biosynthesis
LKIASLTLTLNESPRITECLKHLKPHIDYVLVVDGESTDDTMLKASQLADRVVKRPSYKDWSEEKNYIETLVPDDVDWVLHCDCDELFHERLLPEIKAVINGVMEKYPETIAFRFPRANLPTCSDYPDYQVRLLKKGSGYKWSHPIHSVPTIDGVNVDKIPHKCMTMLDLPIWHLPRRTDIRRPWWSDEKGKRDKTNEEMIKYE